MGRKIEGLKEKIQGAARTRGEGVLSFYEEKYDQLDRGLEIKFTYHRSVPPNRRKNTLRAFPPHLYSPASQAVYAMLNRVQFGGFTHSTSAASKDGPCSVIMTSSFHHTSSPFCSDAPNQP